MNYDLLNTENKDGRHEGKFFILDYPAFVEKKGPQLTFGYEYTRTEAGFNPNWKVGDKVVENGSSYQIIFGYTEDGGKWQL